ncbi:MAG: hypothetical protein IJZ18_04760, partial [Mailhella sp.]|nr:hypothetical protein [Mailhella sp.]
MVNEWFYIESLRPCQQKNLRILGKVKIFESSRSALSFLFSIDMMRAVLDDMENYPVYFCMFQRRFFVLLCFFFALLLCVPAQGLSANPPDYERAKAQL